MVEHGVSLARAPKCLQLDQCRRAGALSEYIMQPYEPAEEGADAAAGARRGRRAPFSTPNCRSGKVDLGPATRCSSIDVAPSHAFAKEEVERFTFRARRGRPTATLRYTRSLALRGDRGGSRIEIRPEEVPRFHPQPGPVAAGPDAQGGAERVCALTAVRERRAASARPRPRGAAVASCAAPR